MTPEITKTFKDDDFDCYEIDVVATATTHENLDLFLNYTGDNTLTAFKEHLDIKEVEYTVYERPKKRPRN